MALFLEKKVSFPCPVDIFQGLLGFSTLVLTVNAAEHAEQWSLVGCHQRQQQRGFVVNAVKKACKKPTPEMKGVQIN